MRFRSDWRHVLAASVVAVFVIAPTQVAAQNNPPGAVGMVTAPAKPAADPIVAEVAGQAIHLSEVSDEIRALPGGGKDAFSTLYPAALSRLIQRAALVRLAHAAGLADNPDVQRHIQEAADQVLEEAYLREATSRMVTEAMLLRRYDQEVRGRPGPVEVHGRLILVPTEADANAIIAKLAAGADFAALARQSSEDNTAPLGGDLGFVRRDSLSPAVAAVLFSLRPGEVTPYPVQTVVGWLVLKAEARRTEPTPSFADAREQLAAEAERDDVAAVMRAALSKSVVHVYDMSGNEVTVPGTAGEAGGAAANR